MNVLVINGPNLNMLGLRPKEHYGALTLDEINNAMKEEAYGKMDLTFIQSNYEGDIITEIQNAIGRYDAIIINPGAYTHTSVAIHDALEIFQGVKVEVHLSHVDDREDFRKVNYIRSVCNATFSGKQKDSYLDAIKYLSSLK